MLKIKSNLKKKEDGEGFKNAKEYTKHTNKQKTITKTKKTHTNTRKEFSVATSLKLFPNIFI